MKDYKAELDMERALETERKLEVFGELQDSLFEKTDGNMELLTVVLEEHGMAIRNLCMDDTGRFPVHPVEYYGEVLVQEMMEQIREMEQALSISVFELTEAELCFYFGERAASKRKEHPEVLKKKSGLNERISGVKARNSHSGDEKEHGTENGR